MTRHSAISAALLSLTAFLAGCGSSGSIFVGSAVISISPGSYTFPSTIIGTTTSPTTFTVTNTGTSTATLSGVTVTGSTAFNATGCGTTLAASSSCAVSVTFSPTAVGTVTGTVTLTDNASNSPQTVTVSGTGTTFPTATVSPTSIDFGLNRINSNNTQQITVTNTGNSTLTVGTVATAGTGYSISTNNCATPVAGGSTCTIYVSFAPTAAGTFTGTLAVPSNAPAAPQSVSLTGRAAAEPSSCTGTSTTSPSPTPPTPNYAGTAFKGKVLAGALPVIGATVQIYAAGRTGNGSAPTLLGASLTTDTNGAFTVPAAFTCPYSNSVLYAVARGGQAGATGTVNPGIVFASILGLCNSITGSPTFTLNEATTAATAWAMQQFMAPGGLIGATSTNGTGIALAAGTFANLINPLNGVAPGTYFPNTGTAPTAKINTVANILNACAVSAATGTACTQLYSYTAAGASVPTSTLDAALNLVRKPAANVTTLYNLSGASTAYAGLTTAPSDFTLFVTYSGAGMNDPSAVTIDSTGRVWVANYFYAASLFSNTGAPVFASGITGNNLYNSYGAAVDTNDVVWIPNEQGPYNLNTGLGTVTLLNSGGTSPATYSAGGLNFPIAVSFDTAGNSWVVDYGNSHTTILSPAGAPLSGPTGYTTNQYVFPVAIATDSKCNAYIANQSSNTVSFTSLDGSMYGSFPVGAGPSGVAVDGNDNVWVANYYGDSVGLFTSAGVIKSGTGFVGGGSSHPQGIAIDGAGNAWIANYRGPSLTEMAAATATTPGAALSPAAGFGPDAALLEAFGLAIDASGNIWVTNFGSNTLTEFIGMATPVKTPLLGPVRIP